MYKHKVLGGDSVCECELCGKKVDELYADMVLNGFTCIDCYTLVTDPYLPQYDDMSYQEVVDFVSDLDTRRYLAQVFKRKRK